MFPFIITFVCTKCGPRFDGERSRSRRGGRVTPPLPRPNAINDPRARREPLFALRNGQDPLKALWRDTIPRVPGTRPRGKRDDLSTCNPVRGIYCATGRAAYRVRAFIVLEVFTTLHRPSTMAGIFSNGNGPEARTRTHSAVSSRSISRGVPTPERVFTSAPPLPPRKTTRNAARGRAFSHYRRRL